MRDKLSQYRNFKTPTAQSSFEPTVQVDGSFLLRAGFTLIELVGVLAVMAILAAIAAPSFIKQFDQAAWQKERADLDSFTNALVLSILKNRVIPDAAGIPGAIARELPIALSMITNTPRGLTRAFLIDQNLSLNGAGLPYIQNGVQGITSPTNLRSPRLIIVSALYPNLPAGIIAGGVINSNTFNEIWNTRENEKPASWSAWPGKGANLCIQRINLEPLFHQLILVNHDSATNVQFSIESSTNSVPGGGAGWNQLYLDGTVVGLHDTNATATTPGTILTRYILKENISFVWDRGKWRGQLIGGNNSYSSSEEFANEAEEFLSSYWNTKVNQGASQLSVLVAMYTFMFEYTLWANESPPFCRHGATGVNPTSVPEYDMLNAMGQNNGSLDKYSDDNTGLLRAK